MILVPPRVSLRTKLKHFDVGISIILLEIFFGHPPIADIFTIRKKFPQLLYRKNKSNNPVLYIRCNRKVYFASECVACRDSFSNVFGADAYGCCFGSRIPASTFYRNAHEFFCVRISSNEIDARMIYARALKAVLG